jgi:hypothetical protein
LQKLRSAHYSVPGKVLELHLWNTPKLPVQSSLTSVLTACYPMDLENELTMPDETIKRAAQEYLAERLSEEGLTYEQTLNRDAAMALAPTVWKKVTETVLAMCKEWNAATKEDTFTCTETMMGDLRIRCAGRHHQMVVLFDPKRLLVRVDNTAREDYEPKVLLSIEGYATDSGRDARLMRNNEPVNLEMLILGQLRVLAGLRRKSD